MKLAHDERIVKQRMLEEGQKQSRETTLLIREARINQDNVKISYGDDGSRVKSVEIVRTAVMLEQARIQAMAAAQRQAGRNSVREVDGQPSVPAIAAPGASEEEKQVPLPTAPNFWDIVDLITDERMPLCFEVDQNPRSRTYGQTVPAFGTILDLLSLCIIGKPGRGKSVNFGIMWVWHNFGEPEMCDRIERSRFFIIPSHGVFPSQDVSHFFVCLTCWP